MLQWEWLGGLPPLRRAAVIGAGSWGTSIAVMLARAGIEVDLGCRTAEQAERIAAPRVNERYLPGVSLPASVRVTRAADLELSRARPRRLRRPRRAPAGRGRRARRRDPAARGRARARKGLVPPLGRCRRAYVTERTLGSRVACLGGPAHAHEALDGGAASSSPPPTPASPASCATRSPPPAST